MRISRAGLMRTNSGLYVPIRRPGYYSTADFNGITTTAQVLNRLTFTPFRVLEPQRIDRIGISITTAGGVGSVVRLGVYRSTSGAYPVPGDLLLDAGTIDGTSATVQEIVISLALAGDSLYWLAAVNQVAAPTHRAWNASRMWPDYHDSGANVSASGVWCFIQNSVSGALPAVAAPIYSNSNPHLVFVRNA